MNYRPTAYGEQEFHERVAWLRARKALEAEAIAEGGSDIVYDEPPTPDERQALGLDRGFFDDEDAPADTVAPQAVAAKRP